MTRCANVWVFAGPSLPSALRPSWPGFVWRPPAVAGDGFEAADASPSAVVLIDGLFDQYPAIRHKELLNLIDQGVPVIGAASMGALRAAELHAYGMIGVGRVFSAYASGHIIGDDEVAVLHGPAEMDWASLTIPLVNVRATLLRARRSRVIDPAAARTLFACAGGLFYQERTWRSIADAASDELPPSLLARFSGWVSDGGYVDLKRLDALEALAMAMTMTLETPAPAPRPAGPQTHFSDVLRRQVLAGRKPDLAPS